MEARHPLLTAEEVAGLLGSRPQTVEQVLRSELPEARWPVSPGSGATLYRSAGARAMARGRARSTGALRRLIAGALHVAADAICPPETR